MMGRREEQMEWLLFSPEELIRENHLLKKIDRIVSFDIIYGLLAPTYSEICWSAGVSFYDAQTEDMERRQLRGIKTKTSAFQNTKTEYFERQRRMPFICVGIKLEKDGCRHLFCFYRAFYNDFL